jgi:plasmid stability protein
MPDLLVCDLDERTIERLKRRADLEGCSLEQSVRAILTNTAPRPADERLTAFDGVRAQQAKPSQHLSEDLIREDRERR